MVEVLTKKYHGLPGYAWLGVVAAGAFVYFRFIAAPSSSQNGGASDTASSDPTAGGQGFDQGFASGFAQGNYAGQIQPVATTPPPGTKNCRTVKDPSGKSQTVCGVGSFVAILGSGGSRFKWVPGATRTIFGYGENGKPFFSLQAWRLAKARRASGGQRTVSAPQRNQPAFTSGG